MNTFPSHWRLLFCCDSENLRGEVFEFVSLCSIPRDTFKSMTVLSRVLMNVISLLLLSFKAYTKSTLIVMWICTEAKIWVCKRVFWYSLLERTIICSTECIFSLFCLYGSCCTSFVTYRPAYTWNFRVFFFTGQPTLFHWTIS